MMFRNFIKTFVLGGLLVFAAAASAADLNERVFTFQKRIAESGNATAQYRVAFMYETGRGVSKDLQSAKKWYTLSAAQNFTASKYRVQYIDAKLKGVSSSDRLWFKTLMKQVNEADGETLFLIGEMHELGIIAEKDLKKARSFYMRSKAQGNPDADSRVYALDQVLGAAKKEAQARKAAERKAELDEQRKQQAALEAKQKREAERKAKAKKLEAERKQLEAERKKLAAEKRRLEKQRSEMVAKKQAAVDEKRPETKKEEVFESDLCSGPAARFMTQCE